MSHQPIRTQLEHMDGISISPEEIPKQHADPHIVEAIKRVQSIRQDKKAKTMPVEEVHAMMVKAAEAATKMTFFGGAAGFAIGLGLGWYFFRNPAQTAEISNAIV